jgi:putative addiction module killer protein
MTEPAVVLHYLTPEGRCPFQEWIESVRDRAVKHAVLARINRIRAGTLGDWRSVGKGVFELRVDLGPGYRIYFGREGKTAVVLLTAGEKRSQDADVNRAREYWRDYEARTKGGTGRRPA